MASGIGYIDDPALSAFGAIILFLVAAILIYQGTKYLIYWRKSKKSDFYKHGLKSLGLAIIMIILGIFLLSRWRTIF